MKTTVLKNTFVVTPKSISRTDLLIKDSNIAQVKNGLVGDRILDCKDLYVLPGFRDQHIHDIVGFMEKQEDPGRLGKISKSIASQGVTAYMLATAAAPTEDLVNYLENIKAYVLSGRNGLDGALIEGANIEGTFIREECAGAQPFEFIMQPNERKAKKVLKSLLKTGIVKLMNIVPDFGTELIEYVASQGVIVGCGHTMATAGQLTEGFRHGLKFIVHLTNGVMGRSFKPFYGGGTYEGALILPLFVELILDGYHVDFRYISDIILRRVQQNRSHEIIAVTDGIFPIPEEIPEGKFRMYSTVCERSSDDGVFFVKGRVKKDGSLLSVPSNTLCSSKLTMDKAFENLLNMLTKDLHGFMIDGKAMPFNDAIKYASMFTSSNQALLQGVFNKTGTIEQGKLADLTILSIEGEPGKYKIKVKKTMVAGKLFNFA